MNNTLNLLNTSLTKLDLILEEIQLELLVLEKMNTNNKNSDLIDIIDGFEKISNKLLKLRANTSTYMNKLEYIDIVNKSMEYALKLKNSINTEIQDKNSGDNKTKTSNKKNNTKKTCKNATYAKSVDFTPIEHTNIGQTVGELPVECTYVIPSVCDVKLEITKKKTVIVKEGSFICKSNKKDISNIESNKVRELRTGWSYLGECTPNNSHLRGSKIYVIKDIVLPSVDAAKMFILGRNLRASDSKYDFKVDNINLKDYLNIGYNT